MNVTDYDNMIDDYNDSLSINENNIDIIISAILFSVPNGLSFLCLIFLMAYKLIKPLLNNK